SARPVASGRVPAERALEFGLALSAFSFVLLAALVNVPTALLALTGNLFYVLVYTRWLKRSTPQNIVIGGAAGAVPPLVGYAVGVFGLAYAVAAVALGAVFAWLAVALWRATTKPNAVRLFHYSLLYLALLFIAMAIDPVLA